MMSSLLRHLILFVSLFVLIYITALIGRKMNKIINNYSCQKLDSFTSVVNKFAKTSTF